MDSTIDAVVEIFSWAGFGLGALVAGVALVMYLLDGTWLPTRGVLDDAEHGRVVRWFDEDGGVNQSYLTHEQEKTLAVIAVRRGEAAASVLTSAGSTLGATPTGHADLEHATTAPATTVVPSPKAAWWLAIACGVVDAAANALMLVALREGDLSIVSALTALYPAGTILLAAIVLRERVAAIQWFGLALALIAGGMLALG